MRLKSSDGRCAERLLRGVDEAGRDESVVIWVERKQGKREVKYELKELEPILSDTYGVIANQEQVMRIAQALAGFSLGQADVLR